MWKKPLHHWREILGWLTIGAFAYVYLYKINSITLLAHRDMAFPFLLALTVLILGWLKLNKK